MPSNYRKITKHNEDQLGKDTGSRKTQVSMYSDPTHFVYELLQNADDYGATEVRFKLSETCLVFEHNGVPFKEENVRAISYFGKGTSRDDLLKTGRFGIGFKSVFAFTASPKIISGDEHFEIYGLYRVREVPYPEGFSRDRTQIILPFNHEEEQPDFVETRVSPEEAYRQIEKCLRGLAADTLLFMKNIREVRWVVEGDSACYMREDKVTSDARLTTISGEAGDNRRYLVFAKVPEWEGERHKPVEIGFAVDSEGRLVPSRDDERLYVLFRTREQTRLRFLLNGPYRTNPARETVPEEDAFNKYLMELSCDLMKELLPKLRDAKALTLQFLAVMPNEDDYLSDFYKPLRETVVHEFRNEALTPTKQGGHAPASGLYRVSDETLSGLVSDADLALLLGKTPDLPLKVAEISRKRNARGHFIEYSTSEWLIGDFLRALEVPTWDIDDLVGVLYEHPDRIENWLKNKDIAYHSKLYGLFHDLGSYQSNNKLSQLLIVLCIDGVYRIGEKCFFPSDDVESDTRFPRVSKDILLFQGDNGQSARSGGDQTYKVKRFLEQIGVCEVDEEEKIKAILEDRYVRGTTERRENYYKQDLERFIAFIEEDPWQAYLFKKYYIFESDEGIWETPERFFLESPYKETRLSYYYRVFKGNRYRRRKLRLSRKYIELGIDTEKFTEFAEKLGVETALNVNKKWISKDHGDYDYLFINAPGKRRMDSATNNDYVIYGFNEFFSEFSPSSHSEGIHEAVNFAALVWETMCAEGSGCLKAMYCRSEYYENKMRYRPSTLVYELREIAWIPQVDGDSFSFIRPCDASPDKLPRDGFRLPHKDSEKNEWLNEIGFAELAKKKEAERSGLDEAAKKFGFTSSAEAEKYGKIKGLLEKQQMTMDDWFFEVEARGNIGTDDFPVSDVRNPGRRRERFSEDYEEAPERRYERQERSERVSKREIDQSAELREWYTNDDGVMFCQRCQDPMPFKRTDGEYYFVAIEALKMTFAKEDPAQFLALCPNCAARYRYFIKDIAGSEKIMEGLRERLLSSEGLEIPIQLGELETSIRFVESHLHDLKVVLEETDD